jgi:hypothetical protein
MTRAMTQEDQDTTQEERDADARLADIYSIERRKEGLRSALKMRRTDALVSWMACASAYVSFIIVHNRFWPRTQVDVLARAAQHQASLLACLCRLGAPKWDGGWAAGDPYGAVRRPGGFVGAVIPIAVEDQWGATTKYELGLGCIAPKNLWKCALGFGWYDAEFHTFIREASSEKEIATGESDVLAWLHALPWPVDGVADGSDTLDGHD